MKSLTQILVLTLAALLTLALPASAAEPGEIDAGSPLVDLLMSDAMTREELASLFETQSLGGAEPPPCVPGEEMFDDVPASHPFCSWIEELARRGVTGGCDANNYCPGSPVTRAQMAAFIVRTVVRAENLGTTFREDGPEVTVAPGSHADSIATCPVGSRLLSGGGFITSAGDPPPNTAITTSHPADNTRQWRVRARNDGAVATTIQAQVLCLAE